MSEMTILDPTGHSKHQWSSDQPDEVETARELYDSLTRKGYQAFRVKRDGSEGERMYSFEPDAESMILTPALRGG